MKIKRLGLTLLLGLCVVFLIYVNIGLNISGPSRRVEQHENEIKQKIMQEYKGCQVERHAFEYVTYSCVVNQKAYFFDNEGSLIVSKAYDETKKVMAQQMAKSYGIDQEAHLGYGKHNPVFVFEDERNLLLLDYDSLEEIFYMKGTYYE